MPSLSHVYITCQDCYMFYSDKSITFKSLVQASSHACCGASGDYVGDDGDYDGDDAAAAGNDDVGYDDRW